MSGHGRIRPVARRSGSHYSISRLHSDAHRKWYLRLGRPRIPPLFARATVGQAFQRGEAIPPQWSKNVSHFRPRTLLSYQNLYPFTWPEAAFNPAATGAPAVRPHHLGAAVQAQFDQEREFRCSSFTVLARVPIR